MVYKRQNKAKQNATTQDLTGFLTSCHGENQFWLEVGGMDEVVHIFSQFFQSYFTEPLQIFLLKFQQTKARRSTFPLFICFGYEGVQSTIIKAKEGGFISGLKVGGRGKERLKVTHLSYANDNIFFVRHAKNNCCI